MSLRELTEDERAASDMLVNAFEAAAAAAGADNNTICSALGKLTYDHAPEMGKDVFRLLMGGRGDELLQWLEEADA